MCTVAQVFTLFQQARTEEQLSSPLEVKFPKWDESQGEKFSHHLGKPLGGWGARSGKTDYWQACEHAALFR